MTIVLIPQCKLYSSITSNLSRFILLTLIYVTKPSNNCSHTSKHVVNLRPFTSMYGHTYNSKNMDQLGKVANPVRGQLNREENGYFPARVRA